MATMNLANQKRKFRDGPAFITSGYVLALIYALIIAIPLYFVLISAFKENIQIFTSPLDLPTELSIKRFLQAQSTVNLTRAMAISFIVVAGAEVLTILLAFPAAYGIARISTGLAPLVEGIFGLGFLIPAMAILMPVFLMVAKASMLDNPLALILFYPALRLPISVFLLSSFIRKLPHELEESAAMDGATTLQVIVRIFFPLTLPGIITVLILNFIDFWNEYLFALIILNAENRTVQIAVGLLKNQRTIDFGLIAAGVVISLIPVYIVFIFFQERIMEGLLAGAVKE